MKRIALLLVLFCLSFAAFPQNQVATLQHNDSIAGVYYGQNALASAYNAASNGDIITLSSGTFSSTNISKAIILRGAGCVYDSVTYVPPTIISGNFSIGGSVSSNTNIEGINMTGVITGYSCNNIRITKCIINSIQQGSGSNMNWQFVNCIIMDFRTTSCYSTIGGLSCSYFKGISIFNSVVLFKEYSHADIYNPTTIYNSIILFDNGQNVKNIVACNSVIATVSGHEISNCSFFNCIGIETGETSLFEGQTAQNVMEVDGYDDVFETFDGTVTYDNAYQLKEEIATSFLGNDGTEVGIYGGMMPYNPRPSYMIMKRCNVAPRSTVDGKLSVDIEIIAEDE